MAPRSDDIMIRLTRPLWVRCVYNPMSHLPENGKVGKVIRVDIADENHMDVEYHFPDRGKPFVLYSYGAVPNRTIGNLLVYVDPTEEEVLPWILREIEK